MYFRRMVQFAVVGSIAVVVAAVSAGSPTVSYLEEGSVWTMGATFSVGVSVDSAGDVSGDAMFSNPSGVSSLASTFYVSTIDPTTGVVTHNTVTVAPPTSNGAGTAASWSFSYSLPTGEDFYGVRVAGSYLAGSNWMALDSQVGGYVNPF